MIHSIAKKPVNEDWHPADIKAALNKAGMTLASIARACGLRTSTSLSHAFVRSYPINEKRIADALGMHPMMIWPSRYNPDGTVKPRGFHAIQFNATAIARNSKAADTDSKYRKAA